MLSNQALMDLQKIGIIIIEEYIKKNNKDNILISLQLNNKDQSIIKYIKILFKIDEKINKMTFNLNLLLDSNKPVITKEEDYNIEEIFSTEEIQFINIIAGLQVTEKKKKEIKMLTEKIQQIAILNGEELELINIIKIIEQCNKIKKTYQNAFKQLKQIKQPQGRSQNNKKKSKVQKSINSIQDHLTIVTEENQSEWDNQSQLQPQFEWDNQSQLQPQFEWENQSQLQPQSEWDKQSNGDNNPRDVYEKFDNLDDNSEMNNKNTLFNIDQTNDFQENVRGISEERKTRSNSRENPRELVREDPLSIENLDSFNFNNKKHHQINDQNSSEKKMKKALLKLIHEKHLNTKENVSQLRGKEGSSYGSNGSHQWRILPNGEKKSGHINGEAIGLQNKSRSRYRKEKDFLYDINNNKRGQSLSSRVVTPIMKIKKENNLSNNSGHSSSSIETKNRKSFNFSNYNTKN